MHDLPIPLHRRLPCCIRRFRPQCLSEQHVEVPDPRLAGALLVLQQRTGGEGRILRESNQKGQRTRGQSCALGNTTARTAEMMGCTVCSQPMTPSLTVRACVCVCCAWCVYADMFIRVLKHLVEIVSGSLELLALVLGGWGGSCAIALLGHVLVVGDAAQEQLGVDLVLKEREQATETNAEQAGQRQQRGVLAACNAPLCPCCVCVVLLL